MAAPAPATAAPRHLRPRFGAMGLHPQLTSVAVGVAAALSVTPPAPAAAAVPPAMAAVASAANPVASAAVIAAAVEEMGVAAATAGAAMAATDGNGSEAGFIGTVGCEGKWQVVLDGIVIGYDMTPAGQVVIATNMAVAGLHPHGP